MNLNCWRGKEWLPLMPAAIPNYLVGVPSLPNTTPGPFPAAYLKSLDSELLCVGVNWIFKQS